MNVRKIPLHVLVAAALIAAAPAIGSSSDRIGAFDFTYESTGDARVRPVQVFDDGRSTFFQFRPGEPIPAIFIEAPTGATLAMPELQGPYVKVPTVWNSFALRLGFGSGRVSYVGAASATRGTSTQAARAEPEAAQPARLLAASQLINGLPPEMTRGSQARVSFEQNSYATPLKGDAVEWNGAPERFKDHTFVFGKDKVRLTQADAKAIKAIVVAARPSTRFEIVGFDDDGHKEKVAEARARGAADALVAFGAARTALVQKTSSEVRESGKGTFIGVVIRAYDGAGSKSTPAASSSVDVAEVLQRLRAGTISPAAAVALLDPSESSSASVQTASAVSPQVWAVRKADENVERMLGRWAREAGWKFLWQNGPVIPITGDAALSRADYLQAADYVISQAKAAGYRLKATAYSNQTLVISEN